MITLRETFKINGVLTDVTSVKLSDPTGTFGVKRDDTNAVVVADDTPMTRVSTGTYEYDLTEPADGLTYTYYVEWVYGGETYRDEKSVTGSTNTGFGTTFLDLKKAVAYYMGYGLDDSAWSVDEITEIEMIVKGGLRQFYLPPRIYENERPHKWSFLTPVETLDTVADQIVYDLPDDFGGIEGPMTYAAAEYKSDIRVVSEAKIRSLRQHDDSTSYPQYVAVRPKNTTAVTGQRYEAVFWPTPNDAYTLSYRKTALVNMLSADTDYPLGGAAHAETLEASCIAKAESKRNDQRGEKWQSFIDCLTASIQHDKTATTAEFFGYNGDNSDGQDSGRVRSPGVYATYKGER